LSPVKEIMTTLHTDLTSLIAALDSGDSDDSLTLLALADALEESDDPQASLCLVDCDPQLTPGSDVGGERLWTVCLFGRNTGWHPSESAAWLAAASHLAAGLRLIGDQPQPDGKWWKWCRAGYGGSGTSADLPDIAMYRLPVGGSRVASFPTRSAAFLALAEAL
jgi:hypothetical protein